MGGTVMGRKLAAHGKRRVEEGSVREEAKNHGSFGRTSMTVAHVRRCVSGTSDGGALGLWGGMELVPKCGTLLGFSCWVGHLPRRT